MIAHSHHSSSILSSSTSTLMFIFLLFFAVSSAATEEYDVDDDFDFVTVDEVDDDDGGGFQSNAIMIRFMERIADFMSIPVDALERVAEFFQRGGFPNDLKAPDRDFVVKFLSVENVSDIYYGLEDGTYVYYNDWQKIMNYREPGNDGYDAINVPDTMQKHYVSCLNPVNITFMECIMDTGMQYVDCAAEENNTQCNDDSLVRCIEDDDNNSNHNNNNHNESKTSNCLPNQTWNQNLNCTSDVKWCQNYTIRDVTEDDGRGKKLGYVPFTQYCLNSNIDISQTQGEIITHGNSNCLYGLERKVMREKQLFLDGDYEYCGGNGIRCNNTFIGGFWSGSYDPRLRPWYKQVRTEQRALWTEPYPFQGGNNLGLTFAKPIYNVVGTSERDVKTVFAGVLAVDYELRYIMELLVQDYGGTNQIVMIVEDKEPHYVIGASTGSSSVRTVFIEDEDKLCPIDSFEFYNCTTTRVPINKFNNLYEDRLLQRVFMEHKKLNFTSGTVRVKESDEIAAKAFMSKGDLYMPTNAQHLKWRAFVVLPMERSTLDASMKGDLSFAIVIVLGTIGFVACASMLAVFFSKRGENAIIYSDWRFTCTFLLGCTVLNLSSFTLLGENNSGMCMIRMWSFNLLFVCALSPLFVKVWRMSILLGASAGFRRVNITHTTAFLFTLPTIVVEVLILMVFSFYDPPRQVEMLGSEQGPQYQEVMCQTDTDSFFLTQLAYNGCLVLVGCVLAFQTRNIDPRFGEAKQLGFCMYNIAFTGITLVSVNQMLATDQESRIVIQSCGVFWGCLSSCFVFSMPRLLEVATGRSSSPRFSLLPSTSGRFAVLVQNETPSRFTNDSTILGTRGIGSGSNHTPILTSNITDQGDSKPQASTTEEIIFEYSNEDIAECSRREEPERALHHSNIFSIQIDENFEKNILGKFGLEDTT